MEEKLKKYCTIISGYAFKSQDLSEGTDIPVIKIGNISNGENIIVDNSTQYVNKEFLSIDKKYHILNGDILISLTGSHMNQPNSMVGRCCRNLDDVVYLLNQRAGKVIPKKTVNKDFLYYVFRLKSIQYAIANRAYGGANQVNVSPKDIMGIKFRIPNFAVQNRVVDILTTYDKLVENNNKRIKLLEQMAENLYKEWFVRFRFPGYEDVEFENGIPKSWEIKRLFEFGKIETGKTPSKERDQNYGGDIMFIKTPDMHDNIYVISTDEFLSIEGHLTQPKKLLPENSIMVSCIGTAGVVAINDRPAHTNQQINSIILSKSEYLEWLYFVCKNLKEIIEMFGATGSTMTNLSKGKFEKLKVVTPPEKLILEYHELTKNLFVEVRVLLHKNDLLAKQRDMLLPRLMSGKLEV